MGTAFCPSPMDRNSENPSVQHDTTQRRTDRAHEILLNEYAVVKGELDIALAMSNHDRQVSSVCERYVEATRRMRRFLVAGEIPPDLEKKLDSAR